MLILVVDDEESLCELVADILSEEYEVIKAFNGKEALELVKQNPPDLIISDVMMPQVSGLELLKTLRSDPSTANIPVILLSAVSLQAPVRGAAAFVPKPFEIDVLEKVVGEVAKNLNSSASQATSNLTDRANTQTTHYNRSDTDAYNNVRQYNTRQYLPYHNISH